MIFDIEKRVLNIGEMFYVTTKEEDIFLTISSSKKGVKKKIILSWSVSFDLKYEKDEDPQLIIVSPKKRMIKICDIPKISASAYDVYQALVDNGVMIEDVGDLFEDPSALEKYYGLRFTALSKMYAYESDNQDTTYSQTIVNLKKIEKHAIQELIYVIEGTPSNCIKETLKNILNEEKITFSNYSIIADELFEDERTSFLGISTEDYCIELRYSGISIRKVYRKKGCSEDYFKITREQMGGMASMWLKKIFDAIENDALDVFLNECV